MSLSNKKARCMHIVDREHPVLHERAAEIASDADLNTTISEMFSLCERRQGLGLAAPQVGLSLRLFVLLLDRQRRVCINPEIVRVGRELVVLPEGCLSYPGAVCRIARPRKIDLVYTNENGKRMTETLTGWWSRVAQHELDHLDGIVMLEREQQTLRSAG